MQGNSNVSVFLDRHSYLLTVLLLLIFFFHVLSIVPQKSLTIDEPANIAVGYAFLRTGDVNIGEDTPPLLRVLSALPLLALHPRLPHNDPSWQDRIHWRFGNVFLDSNPPPLYFRIIFWSRVPLILIACVLGWLIFVVSRNLFGPRAALAALFLFTWEPNILANSILVKTDVAAALVYLWFFYAAWRYLQQPSLRSALHLGTALVVGLLVKFSLFLLFPLSGLVLLFPVIGANKRLARRSTPGKRSRIVRMTGHFVVIIILVVVSLNVGYGLELFRWERVSFPLHSALSQWFSHFLPQTWLAGLETVFRVTRSGWPGFLAGHYSSTGWWYYYPVALAIKVPLPLLLFFVVGLGYGLFCLIRRKDWRWLFPLLPFFIYLIPALTSKVNAGLRHLFPIFPMMFIMTGAMIAEIFHRQNKTLKVLCALLLIALPLLVLRHYPDYLAYFNEVIGGPQSGWKYLSDSNLDWGEELPRLAKYIREKHVEDLKLAYLGGGNPEFYGIRATSLEIPYAWESHDLPGQYEPSSGTYAISVTFLQGTVFGERRDYFKYFRERKAVARLGNSMFVYQVP